MGTPITIVINGLTLRGNFYQPEKTESKVAVLFLHGWTGRPNEGAAEILYQNGFTSMTISLSGHNDSDGNIQDQTRKRSLQEAVAAYDVLRRYTDSPIVVVGNSYGGYLAALLTSERTVTALSLRVASLYPDEGFDQSQLGQGGSNPAVKKWREQKLDFDACRALTAVHDFKGPIQIIEAELDNQVLPQVIENYCRAVKDGAKLDYHLMKNWPHSLGNDETRQKEFIEVLLTWLNQKV